MLPRHSIFAAHIVDLAELHKVKPVTFVIYKNLWVLGMSPPVGGECNPQKLYLPFTPFPFYRLPPLVPILVFSLHALSFIILMCLMMCICSRTITSAVKEMLKIFSEIKKQCLLVQRD